MTKRSCGVPTAGQLLARREVISSHREEVGFGFPEK
jgi:hypothetical protein